MENLYREQLLDHFKHPRNHGTLDHPDAMVDDYNPLCGDRVHAELRLGKKGRIEAITFIVRGCVISTASASLLSEAVLKKPVLEVMNLSFEALLRIMEVSVGPARANCVLLPLTALQKALLQAKKGNGVLPNAL